MALSGSDVIGQAKTGTGKTLGFGLPLLERVTVPADVEAGRAKPEQLTDAPQALVVVPTRELCQQVTNDLLTAGKVRNVRVLAIYGGRAYEPQVEALQKGVDVVVGTPGRLLDLAGQKKLDLSQVRALVLDEADEMLDLGFLPDVEKIIQYLPAKRQTMLFSATMPGQVISLARRYMSQPTHIRATSPDDEGATVANTTQHVFRAHSMDKPEMVSRILQAEGRGLAMIFCRTKRTAADIADQLARRGFASGAVHGDLGQGAREQALRAFRNGKVDVLVCTDVAARGIDVGGVTHVINYQTPEDEKTYLHRIGRTGRAGAKGIAVTLVDWDDIPRWQLINKALDLSFNDPEETYSTSAHLYELLNIPQGVTGVLPRSERTRAGLAAEEVEDLGETGGRDRGPRKAGRDREEERPERTRTPRKRRRMRNGSPIEGEAAAAGTQGSEAAETAADTAEGTTEPRQPRRRRRTRGAASGNAASATATSAATAQRTATAHAVAEPEPVTAEPAAAATATVPVQGTGPDAAQEAPAKPRRRRARGTRAPQGAAPEAAVATAEGRAPVAKAPAPRRPVIVKEDTSVGFQTVEVAAQRLAAERRAAEEAAAAKAAERAAAKAAVTERAPEEPAAEAPAAKPRRTRKTAAKKAEAAVDTAEGTEVTAEATEAVEAPAKPRRTRKTAAKKAEAAVEAAEGTDATAEATEAPAKPRRTRKTAAKKAEAAVDTAEGAEAAAADEAPAKPRRTRKTAAKKAEAAVEAAEGTDVTAEATEAPAKPRRTRKAAAKKTAAAPEATPQG
ncbi:DEAD/DEAH box helicase [Streptomyces ochraceiscleroticus]|uniref:RNA helicase n=1 Tax=Streptomyces ochraceiscleroticus TaxID=47761 RepID=A0ABW1MD91_9ACTN|nr:DEAD/DEAH box helicase [Streptomyces ochraceiscleroticus]